MCRILLVTLFSLGLSANFQPVTGQPSPNASAPASAPVVAPLCHKQDGVIEPDAVTVPDSLCYPGGTAPPGAEETVCVGPGSVTGKVIDSETILTPHFYSFECEATKPTLIAIQLKDQSARLIIGDTVKLKGRLVSVHDKVRNMKGFVLKDAEIIQ